MSGFGHATVTDEHRADAIKLHDEIHQAAALVDFHHPETELGWAPEDAIPILAQAIADAQRQGAKLVMEQRGLIFKKDEIVIDFEHTLSHQRELGEEGAYQELIHVARMKNEEFVSIQGVEKSHRTAT